MQSKEPQIFAVAKTRLLFSEFTTVLKTTWTIQPLFSRKKKFFEICSTTTFRVDLRFLSTKLPKKSKRLQGSLSENLPTSLLLGHLSTRQNLCVDFHEFVFQQKAFHRFFLSATLLEQTRRNNAFKHLILLLFRESELSILSATKASIQKADLLQARPTR